MNKSTRNHIWNLICLVAAAAGLCVALFLTFEHAKIESGSYCSNAGCGDVMRSALGHVGPIPTAALGALMYLAIALLCVARELRLRRAPEPVSAVGATGEAVEHRADRTLRLLDLAIWSIALAAFVVSWLLQYDALFIVRSFCPYCFTSACLVTALFIFSSLSAWLPDAESFEKRRVPLLSIAAVILIASYYGEPQVIQQWRLIHRPNEPTVATAQNSDLEEVKRTVLGDGLHSKGNPNAKVVLVEFGDYECGTCRTANATLNPMVAKYSSGLRFVFRNFPINTHVWGRQAAQAAEAAGAQGKFWEMHDLLFAHQEEMESSDFKPSKFVDWARSLGLDAARFKADMDTHSFAGRVEQDAGDGNRDEVHRTPAFRLITKAGVWKMDGFENSKELQQRVAFEVSHASRAGAAVKSAAGH
jgi:protein-disulfide isomerase/uncharacterized membrane protein